MAPRTWQNYLEENENDPTRAGEAAARDVAAREGENAQARTFRRTFESALRELGIPTTQEGAAQLHDLVDAGRDTSSRVPQGGLALTAEQAQQWQAWQALRTPDGTALTPTAVQTALAENTELRSTEQLRGVTEAAGAKLSVLQDRLRGTNLTVVLKEETVDGKPVQVARVVETVNGQATDRGPLKDYATVNWPDYVPALFPTAQGGGANTQDGTRLTGQSGAGGADQGGNVIGAALGRTTPSGGAERKVVGALDFKTT